MRTTIASRRALEELLFVLLGLPLGIAWFTLLVTGWSLALGLVVTPLVILLAVALGAAIRGAAIFEAALARRLLGIDVHAPARGPQRRGFWRSVFGWLAEPAMWRAQAYLALRFLMGFPLATALVALLASSLGGIAAPFYYWALHGGIHLGSWHVDTLPEALALVPAGAAGLALTMLLSGLFASLHRSAASELLVSNPVQRQPCPPPEERSLEERRRRLTALAGAFALSEGALIAIWLLTGHGNFWPVWPLLSFLLVLGVRGWMLFVDERPELWRRPGMSRSLAGQIGVSVVVVLFLTGVWAVSGAGTYWPVWPLLGLTIAAGFRAGSLYLHPPSREELTQRIDVLTSTRAGAVDQQEAELRRIERDLHDGAQARLVALGMSIGMAEQKLANDPEGARELLEEARQGAGQALRELRDLARGIHPPVLADRGLEAAVIALADASPIRVKVQVDVPRRPAAPVESAAYFVVAEALANAGKHAGATRVDIRILRDEDLLTVEVSDDGSGGANPSGSGLSGLRRRVEALDGKLRVASPPGGPTLVRAEMPCGS